MFKPDPADVLRRHLRGGSQICPEQIEALLGVGERQARRVVRALAEAESPLREHRRGRGVSYSYAPEDLALLDPPEPLTEDEALAVYLAVATARPAFAQSALGAALGAAVAKLVPPDGSVLTFEPEASQMASVGPRLCTETRVG